MPFFALAVLSIILALGGVVVGWAGLDDRNSGLLTGGAVAIGFAALVFGMALLLRELRASRIALIDALANRQPIAPAAPRPAATEQFAPASATDAALATFSAGLEEEANRRVEPPRFPPPVKREGPSTILAPAVAAEATENSLAEGPAIAARIEPEKPVSAPAASLRPGEPPKAEELRPAPPRPILDSLRPGARKDGESLIKPPFRLRPFAESRAAPTPPPLRAESEPAPPVVERPIAVEPPPPVAPPKPPDIDTILNEIIARRDRAQPPRGEERPRPLGQGAPVEPLTGAAVGQEPGSTETVVASREEPVEVEEARAVVAPPEPVKSEPEMAASEPAKVEAAEAIDAVAETPEPETRPEVHEEPVGAVAENEPTEKAAVEPAAEETVVDETIHEPAAAADHPHREHHAEPAAPEEARPVVEIEPEPKPEVAAAPAAPLRKMVRSFSSGPNRYTMYDDGSIEAETPTGRLTFASFDELRRYIDERMNQRGTGT